MNELTHFDVHGASRMVDVGEKPITVRTARASGRLALAPATVALIRDRQLAKGDVVEVARLAGIMAAKQTCQWIPLCHQVPLDSVELAFDFPDAEHLSVQATAKATGRTGVEMEALTAVAAAALTVYDMCKAVDRGIVIEQIQLEEKSGGRSGRFERSPAAPGPVTD